MGRVRSDHVRRDPRIPLAARLPPPFEYAHYTESSPTPKRFSLSLSLPFLFRIDSSIDRFFYSKVCLSIPPPPYSSFLAAQLPS
ncbi:hypothetical protein CEXT_376621 [Caerostris extrusa]|uniref:Uncharacterized protein n=1 Tax=Caerostris extrusa TaxID=172846 RepID=A0AAV4NP22_CAEEX|nr:hypothetical protein CEXT_376621 [Caerostris extrusa]